MLTRTTISYAIRILAVGLASGSLISGAQSLHSFTGGADGAYPRGGLTPGPHGTLYGTTAIGGDPASCTSPGGCGTIYQLTPPSTPGGSWSETVIYAYPSVNGAYAYPASAPTVGPAGELYVASYYGGADTVGEVSEFTPPAVPSGTWTRTELYSFSYQAGEPQNPAASVVLGKNGVLYGTVPYAGDSVNCGGVFGTTYGCGGVYALTPPATPGGAWTEETIYIFQGGSDGAFPITSLVVGNNGVLYGSTNVGGLGTKCIDNTVARIGFTSPTTYAPLPANCGTVFELDPPATTAGEWTGKTLYNFEGQRDGGFPNALSYRNGKLYGTVTFGGDPRNCGGAGCGGVFELSPPAARQSEWTEQMLYSFTSGRDGLFPGAGVTLSADGTIYGTTLDGGDSNACPSTPGCGILYQLKPPLIAGHPWRESVLHRFSVSDGFMPAGGVTLGVDGALYGATQYGGTSTTCTAGCGTVFRVDSKLWSQPWWQDASTDTVSGSSSALAPLAGRVK